MAETARRARLRNLIPPSLRSREEAIPGEMILQERPDTLGLLLWRLTRLAEVWAESTASRRRYLVEKDAFGRYQEQIDQLPEDAPHRLLHSLARLTVRGAKLEAAGIASDLIALSLWAENEVLVRTARRLAEAALLVTPRSAGAARQMGRVCRVAGDFEEAEAWYRHAIVIARATGDNDSYVSAWIGRSKLALAQGRYAAAERAGLKAMRAVLRNGPGYQIPWTYHDLSVTYVSRGEYELADHYAQKAAETYEPGDPGLARLASDVAYSWLTRGEFTRALPVLLALAPVMERHWRRASDKIWANIARTAGAVGDREVYERARSRWLDGAKQPTADGWLEIARGAASLGEFDEARQMASEALRIAKELGEHRLRFDAEALQDEVEALSRLPVPAGEPIPAETAEDTVVRALVGALEHAPAS